MVSRKICETEALIELLSQVMCGATVKPIGSQAVPMFFPNGLIGKLLIDAGLRSGEAFKAEWARRTEALVGTTTN